MSSIMKKLSLLLLSVISLAAIADCLPVRYGYDSVAVYGRDTTYLQRRADPPPPGSPTYSDSSIWSGAHTPPTPEQDRHIHEQIHQRVQAALRSGGDHTSNTHHIHGSIDVSDLNIDRHHVQYAAQVAYHHTMNVAANPQHPQHDANWLRTTTHQSGDGKNHLMASFFTHSDGKIHLSSIRRKDSDPHSVKNQATTHAPTLRAAGQQHGHNNHHAEDGAYLAYEKSQRARHADPHSPAAHEAVAKGYRHAEMAVYGHRQHTNGGAPQLHGGCGTCVKVAQTLGVHHPPPPHNTHPRGPPPPHHT